MKTLKQTAEENHLTYNVTDIESQGQENEVLYGFESYEQAEEIADENGLTLYYIDTNFNFVFDKDKKLYWDEKKPAEGPMIIDNDFLHKWYGDDKCIYTAEDYEKFEHEAMCWLYDDPEREFDSINKIYEFAETVKETLETLKHEHIYEGSGLVGIVDYDDWTYCGVCEKECIIFDDDWYYCKKIFLVAIKED